MSKARVPLTAVIPARRLANLQIDEELATRFGALSPAASETFSQISRTFYATFLIEVGLEALAELLTRVAEPIARLSEDRLESPILHPVITFDSDVVPPPDDPLRIAFGEALAWLAGVLGGRWKFDPNTKRPVDDEAVVPEWFVYCLLEMARRYVAQDPESSGSRPRAMAYLRVDRKDASEWFRGQPSYIGEIVALRTMLVREDSETREQFLLRIMRQTVESALQQLVPVAEAMDEYVQAIGVPYPARDYRPHLDRAKECALVVLGKPVPEGGSGKKVRDDLLAQLGFLISAQV